MSIRTWEGRQMEWQYNPISCPKVVDITALVAVYDMDLPKNFTFTPEYHRCWELNFHDYGETRLYADGKEFALSKHDMILYAPMVEHGITEQTEDASNTVSVSFESNSPLLYRLANRVIRVPNELQKILSSLLKLATYFTDQGLQPNTLTQPINSDELTEPEQIVLQQMKGLLEDFFLRLLFADHQTLQSQRMPKLTAENRQKNLSKAVQEYIEQNLNRKLVLQDISEHFNVSVSKLCRDIKTTTGCSLQELISNKRLKVAKQMILREEYNFTEIAEHLGFSSLHYFSQWFKKMTNRSPTEYATSVKGRSE